ncbi:6-phosphogluconolactonase [Flavobacterium sp. MXW15]|uniref:6-phosphogluconolactonase n=1 Tax=Xanthomonas chitinilytica TaxID=2989819 RepID=A0ABT3JZF4_9XANT|nr:6-phosphogluconolactonase [Xanthomonas sp. H13-6]MCW4453971.1 6-phosphogluconolactonase [Flavobacterium sp. MXW15]MCW4473862.1 6-phosphogluconolactonase [Xanthomonas sp. H13-6]
MTAAASDRIILVRHADADEWIENVAAEMRRILEHEIGQRGRARMLLSGGTTPAPVYQALAELPLEWDRVEVGLVDERWLSPQDRDSNAWLVRNSFLNRAEGAHFDPLVRVGKPLAECVHSANLQAQHSQPPCLAVLGMGNDGHTASLFPGSRDLPRALASPHPYAALDATGCPVANDWPLRITLTPHGLAQAGSRLLLLRGQQKLDVLNAALEVGTELTHPILAAVAAPGSRLRVHWCA